MTDNKEEKSIAALDPFMSLTLGELEYHGMSYDEMEDWTNYLIEQSYDIRNDPRMIPDMFIEYLIGERDAITSTRERNAAAAAMLHSYTLGETTMALDVKIPGIVVRAAEVN